MERTRIIFNLGNRGDPLFAVLAFSLGDVGGVEIVEAVGRGLATHTLGLRDFLETGCAYRVD